MCWTEILREPVRAASVSARLAQVNRRELGLRRKFQPGLQGQRLQYVRFTAFIDTVLHGEYPSYVQRSHAA
jgi:hypothetical protein